MKKHLILFSNFTVVAVFLLFQNCGKSGSYQTANQELLSEEEIDIPQTVDTSSESVISMKYKLKLRENESYIIYFVEKKESPLSSSEIFLKFVSTPVENKNLYLKKEFFSHRII